MTDPQLTDVSFGEFLTATPNAQYNDFRVAKGPQQSRVILDGGSYYYGRIEFRDNTGVTKSVIKADGTFGLYIDIGSNPLGVMMTTNGGVPLYLFSKNGDIKDGGGSLLINSTTLGSSVVNSSLTSVGTLTSLAVSGNVSIGENYQISGNTVLTANTLGSSVLNSSLTSVGILNGLTVDSTKLVTMGWLRVDYNSNGIIYDPFGKKTGFGVRTPSYRIDVLGEINTSIGYRLSGNTVLTGTTLGTNVVNSSLTSVGILNGLSVSGNTSITGNYQISGNTVVSSANNVTTIGGSQAKIPQVYVEIPATILTRTDATCASLIRCTDINYGYAFIHTAPREVSFSVPLGNQWKFGTQIIVKIYWTNVDNPGPDGPEVAFLLQYNFAEIAGVDNGWTGLLINDTANDWQYLNVTSSSPITVESSAGWYPDLSRTPIMFHGILKRNGYDGFFDKLNGTVGVYAITVEVLTDTLGRTP